MSRCRPDPRQRLFPWVWSDPDDDRPDEDEPQPEPPPLRGRVLLRREPRTATLWGIPITLPKPPTAGEAARNGDGRNTGRKRTAS